MAAHDDYAKRYSREQVFSDLFIPETGKPVHNTPESIAIETKKNQFIKSGLTPKQQEWMKEIQGPRTNTDHLGAADKLLRSLTPGQQQKLNELHRQQQALTKNKPEVAAKEPDAPASDDATGIPRPKTKPEHPPAAKADVEGAPPPKITQMENGRVVVTFNGKADASAPRSAITLSGKAVAAYNEDVLEVQTLLKERDIDPGPLDGKEGPLTRAAIQKYAQDTGQDPKTMTLEGMIAEMKENPPKKPEVTAEAAPAAGKPAVAIQAGEGPRINNFFGGSDQEAPKQPEAVQPQSSNSGVVSTRTDLNTGEQIVAGTQKINWETNEITSATGKTPFGEFGKAATGTTPETPAPTVSPDLLNVAKVDTTSAMKLG